MNSLKGSIIEVSIVSLAEEKRYVATIVCDDMPPDIKLSEVRKLVSSAFSTLVARIIQGEISEKESYYTISTKPSERPQEGGKV